MKPSDLHAYAPIVRDPAAAHCLGATVEVSPPTSQGILLLRALRWLDHLPKPTTLAERVDLQVRAVAESFLHRSDVGREDAEDRILSSGGFAAGLPVDCVGAQSSPRSYNHTAAVTTADSGGLVVSALVSVFDDFGSATAVPEFEFVLNSRLLGFDSVGPNAPAPGRRPVHTLAPALVHTADRTIALATPGADGQTQTLLQLLSSTLEDGVPLQEALHRPRWRLVDGIVAVESGTDSSLTDDLESRGYELRMMDAGDELFGAVAAAVVPQRSNSLEAASDPRREVWAGAV
jgi:gamma-glutamyltranspeptidase/glutathione hydrolase